MSSLRCDRWQLRLGYLWKRRRQGIVTGPILLGRLGVAKFVSIASSDGDLCKASAARACLSGSQLLLGVLFWRGMDCCHSFSILVFSHAMYCAFLTCAVLPWVLHSGVQGATHVDEERYVVRPLL